MKNNYDELAKRLEDELNNAIKNKNLKENKEPYSIGYDNGYIDAIGKVFKTITQLEREEIHKLQNQTQQKSTGRRH